MTTIRFSDERGRALSPVASKGGAFGGNAGARRLAGSTLGRFLVVGGVSYVVNQAALALLYERLLASVSRNAATALGGINLGLLVASVVALELSIVVRFVLNDRWTFGERPQRPLVRRFYESNAGSLAAVVIALLAVNLLAPVLGISYLISNSIGIALGLVWNWLWSNLVVWRREPALTVAAVEAREDVA